MASHLYCPPMRSLASVAAALLLLLIRPPAASGQHDDGVRVGVSLGGTSLVAVVVEVIDGGRALDLSVGTWSFRDLSVSLVGKGYLGSSALRPVVGAGLWTLVAWPRDAERGGAALVARFPVGFDWRASGAHYVDGELSLGRALWVRRSDPTDQTPLNRRLVPLPGISYRWLR